MICTVLGVEYRSCAAAAKALGVSKSTFSNWKKNGMMERMARFVVAGKYKGRAPSPTRSQSVGIPVLINGTHHFISIKAAADHYKISAAHLHYVIHAGISTIEVKKVKNHGR
jgi:hypothetical protein